MSQYKCKHFAIYELVPEHIYKKYGEFAWCFLDTNALITLDKLRQRFGPMTVNNYKWGGSRNWSGLRTSGSPYYSPTSQHSFGRAFDILFKSTHIDKVRNTILADKDHEDFELINSIELGTLWLHFATDNCKRIRTFHP